MRFVFLFFVVAFSSVASAGVWADLNFFMMDCDFGGLCYSNLPDAFAAMCFYLMYASIPVALFYVFRLAIRKILALVRRG